MRIGQCECIFLLFKGSFILSSINRGVIDVQKVKLKKAHIIILLCEMTSFSTFPFFSRMFFAFSVAQGFFKELFKIMRFLTWYHSERKEKKKVCLLLSFLFNYFVWVFVFELFTSMLFELSSSSSIIFAN